MPTLNSISSAISDIRAGKMVVVVDDEQRENEGDLIMAASKVTPKAINFMMTYGRGLICAPISAEIAGKLGLYPMVSMNTELHGTNFTVSIDLKRGTSTGISASDRAITIKALSNERSKPQDFLRPGHIFPLRAAVNGVLDRPGHTEATVDLAKLAGLPPAGVLCEIIKNDGQMARLKDLYGFAKKHKLKLISIKDLIHYRQNIAKSFKMENGAFINKVASSRLPTDYGTFQINVYISLFDGKEHVALIKGKPKKSDTVLVRVHSACLTGEIFGSRRCDCGKQMNVALSSLKKAKCGVLLYLNQEGRGIGLTHKIRAYQLQEDGYDTVDANLKLGFDADMRDYRTGALILKNLGIQKIKLMTNNPSKIQELENAGIKVVQRVPIEISPLKDYKKYLVVKKKRLGHLLKDV